MLESIISLLLTICTTTNISNFQSNQDEKKYCEFSSSKRVESERYLVGFNNSTYKLYELEDGYAIYFVDGENETFLEGSYEKNSPFYNYEMYKAYYFGPGEYYYEDNSKLINITEDLCNNSQKYSISQDGGGSDIPAEYANFDLITDYRYFDKLTQFPVNYNNTCGIVAMCILLGYYDTFYNGTFINDTKVHDERIYTEGKEETLLETIEGVLLLDKVTTTYVSKYIEDGYYPHKYWDEYPGTTQALHDLIFDDYISYNETFRSWTYGYPVLPYDLYKMFTNYMSEECPLLLNDVRLNYGNIFSSINVENKVINYIQNDIPAILTLISYTYDGNEVKYNPHSVVAYGYNDLTDCFVVNMGSQALAGSGTILSADILYGYFALEYNGDHSHSTNVSCTGRIGNTIIQQKYAICGCGYVSQAVQS